jgi:cyclopropane-fatty-acyl-phospholipid synthase
MRWFSLEQDRFAARADIGFYSVAALVLAAMTTAELPARQGWHAAGWVLTGLVGWTLAEYALHRFVLHGPQPFKRWHALHHARPQALIATPTLLTALLFATLVLLPALLLMQTWQAGGLVLGVNLGYLTYVLMHHGVHHAGAFDSALRRHRRWHAQHHRAGSSACYGVSVPLWDHVFGTARPQPRARSDERSASPPPVVSHRDAPRPR